MKRLAMILSFVLLMNSVTAQAVDIKSSEESKRGTFIGAVWTNTKESIPLLVYGALAAGSGANLAIAEPGNRYTLPYTSAVFHPAWTALLFALTTGKAMIEVEGSKFRRIATEAAINSAFASAVGAGAYFFGGPVGLGLAVAFAGAKILNAGDNSPLEHVRT